MLKQERERERKILKSCVREERRKPSENFILPPDYFKLKQQFCRIYAAAVHGRGQGRPQKWRGI